MKKQAFAMFDSFEAQEDADLSYWAARTPRQRLRHLEQLRRLNFPGYDGTNANIYPVYRSFERKKG